MFIVRCRQSGYTDAALYSHRLYPKAANKTRQGENTTYLKQGITSAGEYFRPQGEPNGDKALNADE